MFPAQPLSWIQGPPSPYLGLGQAVKGHSTESSQGDSTPTPCPCPTSQARGFSVHQGMGRVPWEMPGARRRLVTCRSGPASSSTRWWPLLVEAGGTRLGLCAHPRRPQHLTDPQASTKGLLVFVGAPRGLGSGTLNFRRGICPWISRPRTLGRPRGCRGQGPGEAQGCRGRRPGEAHGRRGWGPGGGSGAVEQRPGGRGGPGAVEAEDLGRLMAVEARGQGRLRGCRGRGGGGGSKDHSGQGPRGRPGTVEAGGPGRLKAVEAEDLGKLMAIEAGGPGEAQGL